MICQTWLTVNSSTNVYTDDVKHLLSSEFIKMGQEIVGRDLVSCLLDEVNITQVNNYLTMYGAAPIIIGAQYENGTILIEKNSVVFDLHMADYVKIENGIQTVTPIENSFFGWPNF